MRKSLAASPLPPIQHSSGAIVLASYPNPKQTRAKRGERRQKGRALADDEVIKVWKDAGEPGTFGQLTRLCLACAILTRVSSRVCSAA